MSNDDFILRLLRENRIRGDPQTGQVFSLQHPGRLGEPVLLRGCLLHGYRIYHLRHDGTHRFVRSSRVVWLAANGRAPGPGQQVNHVNRDRQDDRIENLRACSPRENAANRPSTSGSASPAAKLSQEQVQLMRNRREQGATLRQLAQEFGVSKAQARRIVLRLNWQDPPADP